MLAAEARSVVSVTAEAQSVVSVTAQVMDMAMPTCLRKFGALLLQYQRTSCLQKFRSFCSIQHMMPSTLGCMLVYDNKGKVNPFLALPGKGNATASGMI